MAPDKKNNKRNIYLHVYEVLVCSGIFLVESSSLNDIFFDEMTFVVT